MKVRWHNLGDREWSGEVNGTEVARAVNTSATGSDDYPWDWYLADAGVTGAVKGARHSGAAATLRYAKAYVMDALEAWD